MKRLLSTAAVRLAFAAGLIAFVTGVHAQSPTPTPTPQASPAQTVTVVPPANSADVATMDAIVASLYDVISGPPGARNWDRFRSLFVPGARLIPTGARPTGEVGSRVLTPDEYAQRAAPRFEKDGFFEREVSRRLEKFGSIAHIFSTYESRHKADDAKPFARGINSIQLMNDGKRWWIVTVFWQAEDEKNPLPAEYLKTGSLTFAPKADCSTAKLDSHILVADPKTYFPIREPWQNPNVYVDLESVYLTTTNHGRERLDSPDRLACALTSLSVSEWPFGRVVTFSQSTRIPILVPDEKNFGTAYSNLKLVTSILKSLGIDSVYTPIN